MSTVKIQNAHKFYNKGRQNELHVMDGITLELPQSGMVAVFGRSGCGKTTLLNAIGGLDKLNSGSITLFGEDISKNTDALRNRYIGYIFQNYNLNPKETVFENVAAALRLSGMKDEDVIFERTVAALSNVEMDNFKLRTPDTLSGGQQQRVAIARALVKNPKIILADEPTGNLDEANTVTVMEILKEISKTQLVILVTHEASLVDLYCDRVIELSDGRVVSVRENETTSGYRQRGKNDIYLGELQKHSIEGSGVSLEYFGEPMGEIKLRIISHEGKLYLKSDCESLKILDNSSEVKLHEGVFREDATPAHKAKIDMSRLPPYEGKGFGRLYTWRSSFVSALRENFSSRKTKGKRLLKLTMFCLSLVLVFMTAGAGVPIRDLMNVRSEVNPSFFYLPLSKDGDYSAVTDSVGKNGIDYAKLIAESPFNDSERITFRVGNFVTASGTSLRATGRVMDVSLAKELTLLAGSGEIKRSGEVIITRALADEMIDSSKYSYIESYGDLVGLVSAEKYMEESYLRIVGIVDSTEKCFFFDSLTSAWFVFRSAYISHNFLAASLRGSAEEIAPGSVNYYHPAGEAPHYSAGSKVTVFGRSYNVAKVEKLYTDIMSFRDWVYDVKGEKLPTFEEYRTQNAALSSKDENRLMCEWLFELQMPLALEYAKEVYENTKNGFVDSNGTYFEADYSVWAVAKGIVLNYIELFSEGRYEDAYGSYLYKQKTGSYPTSAELRTFLSAENADFTLALKESNNANMDAYYNDINQRYYGNGFYQVESGSYFLMNDADYIALSYSAGKSDEKLPVYAFEVHELGYLDEIHYQNHLAIHASDPAVAREYLENAFGDDLITPEDVFEETVAEYKVSIIGSLVSIAVILVLMCLCTFFIMRSNFMPKVKEVGVMRAIGVSRGNVAFRFAVEGFVLTTLTILPGYLVSAFFIGSLSDAPLFSQFFFFPPYIAILLFAVIYASSVFFGALPALTLLRKTPSEILAKYDI